MENRHAFFITAHGNFKILKKLIELLDDEKNDIYLNIDGKLGEVDELVKQLKEISPNIKAVLREKVNWGGYSLIESTLKLLKLAVKEEYLYYHFISGVDLPIKSNKKIHDFFEQNQGKEFIHFRNIKLTQKNKEKISLYHFFQEKMKSENLLLKILYNGIERVSLGIQRILKIDRTKKIEIEYKMGANWASITHQFALYILEKEEWVKLTFTNTRSADEVYLQTMAYNSNFKQQLYYQKFDDNYEACMRYIDWTRGKPYVWRSSDYEELINSKYLFARKFDENVDWNIVEKIYKTVKKENKI